MRDERHSQICGSQTQSKAECQCQFVDSIIITDILDDCINFVNFSSQQGINPFNHIQQLSDMLVVSTMPTDKTLTGQRLSHMLFFHYQTYTFKPHSKFNSPFCQLQLYIILLHCLCLSCVYNLQQFFYSAVFLHVSGFYLDLLFNSRPGSNSCRYKPQSAQTWSVTIDGTPDVSTAGGVTFVRK